MVFVSPETRDEARRRIEDVKQVQRELKQITFGKARGIEQLRKQNLSRTNIGAQLSELSNQEQQLQELSQAQTLQEYQQELEQKATLASRFIARGIPPNNVQDLQVKQFMREIAEYGNASVEGQARAYSAELRSAEFTLANSTEGGMSKELPPSSRSSGAVVMPASELPSTEKLTIADRIAQLKRKGGEKLAELQEGGFRTFAGLPGPTYESETKQTKAGLLGFTPSGFKQEGNVTTIGVPLSSKSTLVTESRLRPLDFYEQLGVKSDNPRAQDFKKTFDSVSSALASNKLSEEEANNKVQQALKDFQLEEMKSGRLKTFGTGAVVGVLSKVPVVGAVVNTGLLVDMYLKRDSLYKQAKDFPKETGIQSLLFLAGGVSGNLAYKGGARVLGGERLELNYNNIDASSIKPLTSYEKTKLLNKVSSIPDFQTQTFTAKETSTTAFRVQTKDGRVFDVLQYAKLDELTPRGGLKGGVQTIVLEILPKGKIGERAISSGIQERLAGGLSETYSKVYVMKPTGKVRALLQKIGLSRDKTLEILEKTKSEREGAFYGRESSRTEGRILSQRKMTLEEQRRLKNINQKIDKGQKLNPRDVHSLFNLERRMNGEKPFTQAEFNRSILPTITETQVINLFNKLKVKQSKLLATASRKYIIKSSSIGGLKMKSVPSPLTGKSKTRVGRLFSKAVSKAKAIRRDALIESNVNLLEAERQKTKALNIKRQKPSVSLAGVQALGLKTKAKASEVFKKSIPSPLLGITTRSKPALAVISQEQTAQTLASKSSEVQQEAFKPREETRLKSYSESATAQRPAEAQGFKFGQVQQLRQQQRQLQRQIQKQVTRQTQPPRPNPPILRIRTTTSETSRAPFKIKLNLSPFKINKRERPSFKRVKSPLILRVPKVALSPLRAVKQPLRERRPAVLKRYIERRVKFFKQKAQRAGRTLKIVRPNSFRKRL